MSTDRDKALEMALSQIDKQFGKGSIMRMGEKTTLGDRRHLDRCPGAGPGTRDRRLAARPRDRDLRPGVVG